MEEILIRELLKKEKLKILGQEPYSYVNGISLTF